MVTKRRVHLFVPAFFVCLLFIPVGLGWLVQETTPTDSSTIYPPLDKGRLDGVQEQTQQEDPAEYAELPVSAPAIHLFVPEEVRGIYWTAVTARTKRADQLIAYMLDTGLNAVVIDVKMDNGQLLSPEEFTDILQRLREAGIYRIARIAVMRDGAFARAHPELAMHSVGGGFWYDNIGSLWVDPAAPEVAQFALDLGQQFYEAGFDEIQYDYVRFASDGSVNAIVYPVYNRSETKVVVMRRFFETVGGGLRAQGIPVSFDVFGMTFWSHSDYNIGQRLVDVLPYTDWVSPMVYPSHYPDGFKGYGNPALYPYEIVKMSLDKGVSIMGGIYAGSDEELTSHFRPWLQDFDIGAVYTSSLIEAQIQATRDAGASGWILWNARNVYESANYLSEVEEN